MTLSLKDQPPRHQPYPGPGTGRPRRPPCRRRKERDMDRRLRAFGYLSFGLFCLLAALLILARLIEMLATPLP